MLFRSMAVWMDGCIGGWVGRWLDGSTLVPAPTRYTGQLSAVLRGAFWTRSVGGVALATLVPSVVGWTGCRTNLAKAQDLESGRVSSVGRPSPAVFPGFPDPKAVSVGIGLGSHGSRLWPGFWANGGVGGSPCCPWGCPAAVRAVGVSVAGRQGRCPGCGLRC